MEGQTQLAISCARARIRLPYGVFKVCQTTNSFKGYGGDKSNDRRKPLQLFSAGGYCLHSLWKQTETGPGSYHQLFNTERHIMIVALLFTWLALIVLLRYNHKAKKHIHFLKDQLYWRDVEIKSIRRNFDQIGRYQVEAMMNDIEEKIQDSETN
jgi:hypothetical protein